MSFWCSGTIMAPIAGKAAAIKNSHMNSAAENGVCESPCRVGEMSTPRLRNAVYWTRRKLILVSVRKMERTIPGERDRRASKASSQFFAFMIIQRGLCQHNFIHCIMKSEGDLITIDL
jgi:hypothetical protein